MYTRGCYRDFALKATPNYGSSNADVRVSPLPGQGVPSWMKVECSRSMRDHLNKDTVAILRCQVTCREGGTDFLYAHFSRPYKLVSREEAEEMIARGELGFPED